MFKNMCSGKVWKDIAGKSTDGCFNVQSGKRERSILSHIGCAETGLLGQCMLLFRGSKSNKSAGYHTEMNWHVFSHWCDTKVLLSIAATGVKSVVILDRATYHTTRDEQDKRPATSWNDPRLVEAINRWGGATSDWPLDWIRSKTKMQLLDYARRSYPSPKYKMQKITDKFEKDEFSIKILFLPVSHPELNTFGMVNRQ